MNKLKYIGVYLTPLLALLTFNSTGFFAYIGVFTLYILVPILENIMPKNTYNFSKNEKELAKKDFFYDLVLYLLVPIHLFVIYNFLIAISNPEILLST